MDTLRSLQNQYSYAMQNMNGNGNMLFGKSAAKIIRKQAKASKSLPAGGAIAYDETGRTCSENSDVNEIRQINEETSLRNEELVRISELAKEADRQKSLFIQNVSHQIRTPLNIIMGFAQVLRESISVLSKEEVKSITGLMYHNAMTLDRMTLMLFDSSARGTTEELYTKRDEEVPCNEVALESIAGTLEHFPDLHISFETTLPDSFCIYSSHVYIVRSIREILYNSAKYSDGKNISLRVSEAGSKVRYVFEDTGPGIPIEDINRLFEPFTKANDLSDGLGLFIL